MGNIIMFGAGYYTVSEQLKAAMAVGLFAWLAGGYGLGVVSCYRAYLSKLEQIMTTTCKPLPPMARIRQSFVRPRVDDAAVEMTAQMELLCAAHQGWQHWGHNCGQPGHTEYLRHA